MNKDMDDPADVLFRSISDGVRSSAKAAASRIRAVIGASQLTAEQHKALDELLQQELEAFTTHLLGRFDNVGCSLPDGILGYRIIAKPCIPGVADTVPGPELDIRDGERDYADMWRDHRRAASGS